MKVTRRGGGEILSIRNTVNTAMSLHTVLDMSVVSRVGSTMDTGDPNLITSVVDVCSTKS